MEPGLAQIGPEIGAIIGQAIGNQRGSRRRMAGGGEAAAEARGLHPRRWPMRWEGEITKAPPALPVLDATLHYHGRSVHLTCAALGRSTRADAAVPMAHTRRRLTPPPQGATLIPRVHLRRSHGADSHTAHDAAVTAHATVCPCTRLAGITPLTSDRFRGG